MTTGTAELPGLRATPSFSWLFPVTSFPRFRSPLLLGEHGDLFLRRSAGNSERNNQSPAATAAAQVKEPSPRARRSARRLPSSGAAHHFVTQSARNRAYQCRLRQFFPVHASERHHSTNMQQQGNREGVGRDAESEAMASPVTESVRKNKAYMGSEATVIRLVAIIGVRVLPEA